MYLEGCIALLGESDGSSLVLCNLQPPENFQEISRHRKWWCDPGFKCSSDLATQRLVLLGCQKYPASHSVGSGFAVSAVRCLAEERDIPRGLVQTGEMETVESKGLRNPVWNNHRNDAPRLVLGAAFLTTVNSVLEIPITWGECQERIINLMSQVLSFLWFYWGKCS